MTSHPAVPFTVDFTSDGMPLGIAAGNLWLVRLATWSIYKNHKFPAVTATGVPCEVKSTVATASGFNNMYCISI